MSFPAHLLVSGRRVLLRHVPRLICLTVIALESVDLAAALPPPIQPVPETALLALAQKKFGTLSRAEEELFRAAQEGRAADVRTSDKEKDNPANAANWPADRAVRAACIAWICTDAQASALVSHQGLRLYGMRIEGGLDLSNAEIKFSLRGWKCAFSGNIDLRDARLRGFYLVGCQIRSLNANRAIIDSSFLLRERLRAEGEINLIGAKIDGNLDCRGAQFLNAKGPTLNAEAAKINGSVFLSKMSKAEGEATRFEAGGEVNLVAATIGGDLDCEGGQFSNAKGPALNADAAKINGSVFLRKSVTVEGEVTRFEADGEVTFLGATIGGDLDCEGGHFSNAKGLALDADAAKIGGRVYLRKGFKAEGEVKLLQATIGGDLDCEGGQFSNAEGPALNADAAKIEGRVFLRKGFKAEGEVNFVGATIGLLQIREIIGADQMILDLGLAQVGTFWDEEKSWPKAGNLILDGFRYDRLYENAPLEADKRKNWLGLQRGDKFRPQPYEQLAAVLRQMGHERDAREVMIEKNQERAKFTQFLRGEWWWYNCFGWFIGYGYTPSRAFLMSLAMILLGAFLFRRGFKHNLIGPTNENAYARAPDGQVIEENGRPNISQKYPVFNAFVYSFESFVPLLKLDQSAHWRPNANHGAKTSVLPFWSPRTGSLLRAYLYFHVAAGWLLTTLWVGAVTGLVKT